MAGPDDEAKKEKAEPNGEPHHGIEFPNKTAPGGTTRPGTDKTPDAVDPGLDPGFIEPHTNQVTPTEEKPGPATTEQAPAPGPATTDATPTNGPAGPATRTPAPAPGLGKTPAPAQEPVSELPPPIAPDTYFSPTPPATPAERALETRLAEGHGTGREARDYFQTHGYAQLSTIPFWVDGVWWFPVAAQAEAGAEATLPAWIAEAEAGLGAVGAGLGAIAAGLLAGVVVFFTPNSVVSEAQEQWWLGFSRLVGAQRGLHEITSSITITPEAIDELRDRIELTGQAVDGQLQAAGGGSMRCSNEVLAFRAAHQELLDYLRQGADQISKAELLRRYDQFEQAFIALIDCLGRNGPGGGGGGEALPVAA